MTAVRQKCCSGWNCSRKKRKAHLCSILLPLLLCQRSIHHIYVGFLLGCSFCPMDLFILLPIPYCMDYCSFVIILEIGLCSSSKFVLLFQYCVDYSGLFPFDMKTLQSICLYLQSSFCGFLGGYCIKYID